MGDSVQPPDAAERCALALGIERPLLLLEIEPLMVLRQERCLATREELAADAAAEWQMATTFEGSDPAACRRWWMAEMLRTVLRLAQLQDRNLAHIIGQKRDEADPARGSGDLLGEPALRRR